MKIYDVIVIGAGPSGSVLAYLCATYGLSTLLIEAKELPRYKACGGGLTYNSIKILQEIGLSENHLIQKECRSAALHLLKQNETHVVASDKLYMTTVKRAIFDNYLFDRAIKKGCDCAQEYFKYYQIATNHIEVITNNHKYIGRLLVGADGALSKVHKQLTSSFPHLFADREYLYAITTNIPLRQVLLDPNTVHLFFNFAERIECAWAFPTINDFNTGCMIYHDRRNRNPVLGKYNSFLTSILNVAPPIPEIHGGFLPIFWSHDRPAIQKGRVLLVGDAAGFIDEWTGEGIYYSLLSALFAAKAINCFMKSYQLADLERYTKMCKTIIYRALSMSHFFANIFRKNPSAYAYL